MIFSLYKYSYKKEYNTKIFSTLIFVITQSSFSVVRIFTIAGESISIKDLNLLYIFFYLLVGFLQEVS